MDGNIKMSDPYEAWDDEKSPQQVEFKHRSDLKKVYFDFLGDFKNYLAEFVRESMVDLTISAIDIDTTPKSLFDGAYGGMNVILKNQGNVECYVSTDRQGAYRLDPNEKEQFWLNKETIVVTLSGCTTLGFIRT